MPGRRYDSTTAERAFFRPFFATDCNQTFFEPQGRGRIAINRIASLNELAVDGACVRPAFALMEFHPGRADACSLNRRAAASSICADAQRPFLS